MLNAMDSSQISGAVQGERLSTGSAQLELRTDDALFGQIGDELVSEQIRMKPLRSKRYPRAGVAHEDKAPEPWPMAKSLWV